MAECNVILECCTGQTGCNEKVTIGYLKNFIVNGDTYLIKTTAGTDVYIISQKPDTYEPTYSELTNGSILPMYVDGGSNRGASSIDGILINGNHESDETINQKDLILVYTRFKRFSISAGKTSLDACGDSTTLSHTYTLTKTVKGISVCDPLTYSYTSTDVYDTQENIVTYNGGCDWIEIDGSTITAEKNTSEYRVCFVTASLIYKGTDYSSRNVLSMKQSAAGGSWVYSSTTYDSLDVETYDSLTYGCEGGEFELHGIGHYTEWFYWRDGCGEEHTDITEFEEYTEDAGTEYGSFPACPDARNQSTTLTITYHGISGSKTFMQSCTCDGCESYNEYGSCNGEGNVGDCGGSVTIRCNMPITTHTKTWIDGECIDTTGVTAETQSIVVEIPENTTSSVKTYTGSKITQEGGTIHYTISQDAGPCGGCGEETTTYEVSNVIVDCTEHENVQIEYTSTTTYQAACPSVTATGVTDYAIDIPCNSGSTIRTYNGQWNNASFTITQNTGSSCCPIECVCSDLTISRNSVLWAYDDLNPVDIMITSASCISSISTSSSSSHFNVNIGTNKITVSPESINTGTQTIVSTLVISYYASGERCSTGVTLAHVAKCINKTCSDNELTVTGVTTPFNTNSHINETIGTYDASDCVIGVSATTNSSWLRNVSADTSTSTIKGTMSSQECNTSQRRATITMRYELSNGNICSTSTWIVKQNGDSTPCTNPCSCSNFSANTTNLEFDSDGVLTTNFSWIKSPDCDDTFTLSGDSHIIGTPVLNSDGTITISAYPNTSTTSTYSGQIKVMLNSSTCTTFNYTVDILSCDCTTSEITVSGVQELPAARGDGIVIGHFTATCINGLSFSSTTLTSLSNPRIGTTGMSSGNITGTVIGDVSANTGFSTRNVNFKAYYGGTDCNEYGYGTQLGECTCSNSNIRVSGKYGIPMTGGTGVVIGNFSAYCITNLTFSAVSSNLDNPRIGDTGMSGINITGTVVGDVDRNDDISNVDVIFKAYYKNTDCNKSATGTQLGECVCNNSNITVVGRNDIPHSSGNDVVIGYFTASCITNLSFLSNDAYVDNPRIGTTGMSGSDITGTVVCNISANTSYSSRNVTFKAYYNNVDCNKSATGTQLGECACSNSNITVVGQNSIPVAGGNGILIGYFTASCISNLSFISNDTYVHNPTTGATGMSSGNITGTVVANVDANDGHESRNVTFKAYYNNVDCNKSATGTQLGECTCSNSNITVVGENSIPMAGGIGLNIGYFTASCISNLSFISNDTYVYNPTTGTTGMSGSNITGTVVANVDANDGRGPRNVTFKAYYNNTDCGKSATGTQIWECTCVNSNITLSAKNDISASGGNGILIGNFTASCINGLSFSSTTTSILTNPRIGTTGMSSSNITGTVIGNVTSYTGYTTRSIGFKAYYNNTDCYKSATGTQLGECTCNNSNFRVSPTSVTVGGAGGSTVNISFTSNCGTVSAVTSSTWISGMTHGNGYITIRVKKNELSTSRTGTVTIYHCNGNSYTGCSTGDCYQNVTVTQNPGCECSDFKITNGLYSASCISNSSHSDVPIAYYSGNCGQILTMTSTQTWAHNLWASGGYIYATIDANCGAARTTTITVPHTASGSNCTSETFTLKQCGGGYSGITANPPTISCEGGTITFTANPRS